MTAAEVTRREVLAQLILYRELAIRTGWTNGGRQLTAQMEEELKKWKREFAELDPRLEIDEIPL